MADKTNIFTSKKFKYGTYAVVFIAVVVALIIALNLVVSFLDRKYDWRFDLTESKLYSLSDATDETLQKALGDKYADFDITITFCAARDLFEYYDSSRTDAVKYYSSVRDIAEEYAKFYDGTGGKGKVTVRYIDINADPAEANRLKQQAQLETINWKNIVIQNTSNTEYYRVLAFDACYFTDEDTGALYQFQAENKFTAAMIQCALAENITVAFTTGHGESHSGRLEEIFQLSTMNVCEIDLDKEDIPDDVKIIVISDPKYDFTYGAGGAIDKITRFMADKGTYNSLMVFVNADTPDLPNLRDYLYEQWGLDYMPNYKITDDDSSLKGSNGESLVALYAGSENGNTASYSVISRAANAKVQTVLPNCVALDVQTGGDIRRAFLRQRRLQLQLQQIPVRYAVRLHRVRLQRIPQQHLRQRKHNVFHQPRDGDRPRHAQHPRQEFRKDRAHARKRRSQNSYHRHNRRRPRAHSHNRHSGLFQKKTPVISCGAKI